MVSTGWALREHLVLREGHHLLREVAEPGRGGPGLVAHHVFGGDGIAQNLQEPNGTQGPTKRAGERWGWGHFMGCSEDFGHQLPWI